jgi:hypothetical protein
LVSIFEIRAFDYLFLTTKLELLFDFLLLENPLEILSFSLVVSSVFFTFAEFGVFSLRILFSNTIFSL